MLFLFLLKLNQVDIGDSICKSIYFEFKKTDFVQKYEILLNAKLTYDSYFFVDNDSEAFSKLKEISSRYMYKQILYVDSIMSVGVSDNYSYLAIYLNENKIICLFRIPFKF